MAGQRPPISLAALSKQVSDAISYNIHDFLDEHSIGQAVLQTVWDDDDIATFGGFLASENAEKAVQEAVGDTCNDEAIEEAVTKALQDAGFTNDPPALEAPNIDEEKKTEEPVATAIKAAVAADLGPQPSVAMDVTALREQTLANARVIHSLYAHTIVPTNFAETEVIVISYGVENFHAAVVRARVFPDVKIGSELIITMQVHNCKNTLEALEKLYELSRAKLSRAHELAANSGPGGLLGEWKQLAL